MFFGVEELTKTYESAPVLENVSFSMEKGEMVSIIGPSGAGKTTLLKLIAELERPTSGRVVFQNEPSRDNPVIMVFQDYVLFPSMSVFENVAFGLRARRLSGGEVRRRVMEVLDYFDLVPKADAYPEHLSGGQRQRVAIARGLVVNPMMLLLDEPFANLDRNLKLQTAEFIRETQRNFGVTTLSVTHDLEEAFVMSDRIGLVMDGRLVQFGEARDVYFNPVHEEAARFLGPLNVLESGVLALMGCKGARRRAVRPESLRLTPRGDGAGRVLGADFAGHFTKYLVEVGDTVITVYGTNSALRRGDRVAIEIIE